MKNLILTSILIALTVIIAVGKGSSFSEGALLAAYDFEQIVGGVVPEVSGNGYDGELAAAMKSSNQVLTI